MKHLAKVPLVALALVLAFSVAPSIVFAQDGESSDQTQEQETETEQENETLHKLFEQRKEAAEKRREDAKQELENQREDAKQLGERFKKACENRRESFKNRLENMATRSEKFIGVLDKIVERVKEFKDTKGLTVANYDALIADIEAKKLVVHDLQELQKQKAEADFSCERDAAKESVGVFGDLLHQQIDALKDYKTSVKNLIVAVKTAAEATETEQGDSNEGQ